MWIKDKVNDCYKMSHSHLITIEKVNRHYILYFRDRMIKSFPTLTAVGFTKENLMAINAPTNLLTICQRKKNVIKDIG